MGLIFAIALIAFGLLFIVGGLRKWRDLIDPPKNSLFLWHQVLLRSFIPIEHMPWYTAVIGLVYVVIGLFVFFRWMSTVV
jgi:uncharacterized membrane protein YphA (DoxX/SURF4 family)